MHTLWETWWSPFKMQVQRCQVLPLRYSETYKTCLTCTKKDTDKTNSHLFQLSRVVHTIVFIDFSARCFIKWLANVSACKPSSEPRYYADGTMQMDNNYSCTLFIGWIDIIINYCPINDCGWGFIWLGGEQSRRTRDRLFFDSFPKASRSPMFWSICSLGSFLGWRPSPSKCR